MNKIRLTPAGKFLLLYLGILSITVFLLVKFCFAGEVSLYVEWAYNGAPELQTKGFRIYQRTGEEEPKVIVDITDLNARKWSGKIDIPTGRSYFSMDAYTDDNQSDRSDECPFEYIEPETPGIPAPTVIFKFN